MKRLLKLRTSFVGRGGLWPHFKLTMLRLRLESVDFLLVKVVLQIEISV